MSPAEAPRGALDPAVLQRLGRLDLKARIVAQGIMQGLHRSPHHGASIEFAEHKVYSPGDDLRRLDWRAVGRLDRYYVKRFEDETNLRAWVVVDSSGSMGYAGTGRPSKFAYARVQAAATAWLLAEQHDAGGVGLFADDLTTVVPPRSGPRHLHDCLHRLEAARPRGASNTPRALATLADRLKPRSLVLVFADFLEDADALVAELRKLSARRCDVAVFHVLDPDEIDFPFDDLTLFDGLEGETPVPADCASIRDTYLRLFDAHRETLRDRLTRAGVEYTAVRTDEPYDAALVPFLKARMRA